MSPSGEPSRCVLHLVSSFDQGGSERQALQLLGLLQAAGRYRVRLACLRPEGVLRAHAQRIVTDIQEYPLTSFYDANAVSQLRRFVRFLKRERVDIVQTHDFYTNVFGMAGATLAGVKVRIAARRETEGIRTRAQKTVERWSYRAAHAVVANARAVGLLLAQEGVPGTRIAVVHNGVPLDRAALQAGATRTDALQKLGLPPTDECKYVTILANMRYAVKDQATFLRAAAHVSAKVPGTSFLLAGEGELQGELRSLASTLGLDGRAIFLGRCTAVAELLAISDVCVLSSRAEGFPNAILEYMAAGRPVVSTDVGGVREAIGSSGEAGYLVEPGNAEQMGERVVELLRDEGAARVMGTRARRIVETQFSPDVQLRRTMALYDRLLAEGRLQEAFWEPDIREGNAAGLDSRTI